MEGYDYWELFWKTGMPEAWMLSRPTERYLNGPGPGTAKPAEGDLPRTAEPLRTEEQKRAVPTD